MRTQIIKLDSFKVSLKQSLKKLAKKFEKKNAEITVIVKESESHTFKVSKSMKQQSQQENGMEIQNYDIEKSILSESNPDSENLPESLAIRISKHDVFPNVLISSYKKKEEPKQRRASLDLHVSKIQQQEIISKNADPSPQSKPSSFQSPNYYNEDNEPINDEFNQSATASVLPNLQIFGLSPHSSLPKLQKPNKVVIEQENDRSLSDSRTEDESSPQSLFMVENKLNEAISYIRNSRLFELEEFLYDFKTKYIYMSERVQVKWRLLMAYCKQNRKEYERASILYSQVLELIEMSPKTLMIDTADINHRLGICYMEIRKWNEGIIAFANALNQLKATGRTIKYAECINNLGTLYLSADHVLEAQKCFMISYSIKKEQYPPGSRKLISSLLNILECNIMIHNYEQAEKIINVIEIIVNGIKENDMLKGGLNRRRGKVAFLKGDLKTAKKYYLTGLDLLMTKFPYSLEFGELMNNLAVLRMEENELNQSKILFNKAMVILNFYYTKDSLNIQTIKKNIELVDRLISTSQEVKSLQKQAGEQISKKND